MKSLSKLIKLDKFIKSLEKIFKVDETIVMVIEKDVPSFLFVGALLVEIELVGTELADIHQ